MRGPLSLRIRFALFFALVVTCALLLFSGLLAAVLIAEELEEHRTGLELDPDPIWDPLRKVGLAFAVIAPVGAAGAMVLGYILSRRALAPLREANERVIAARASDLDLTLPVRGSGDEWDELAQTLNRLLADARGAMMRIRRFTGDAAHELRTPLTALIGTAEVALRRDRTPGEYREVLQGIQSDGLRLAALVDALLTLARADGGALVHWSTGARLDEVARDVVARSRHEAERLGKSVELKGADTPLLVQGDGVLLGRVLENLLDNALKHGGGRVQVVLRRQADHVRIDVSDDGPGIPPHFAPRLFERFAQAEPTHERRGLGLGLALARAISEAHGGTLVHSPCSQGATFSLELPLLRA